MNNRQSIQSPEPDPTAIAKQEEQNMEDELETLEGFIRLGKQSKSCFYTGLGLGPDLRDFLTKQKWPLNTEEQALRYHAFVQIVVNRIRAGESNATETEHFIAMFSQLDDWMYLLPTLEMLPELAEHGPACNNDEIFSLVKHVQRMERVKEKDRLRRIADRHSIQPTQKNPTPTAETVMADAREKVARLLFGLKWEGNATPAMKRLVTSWVQVGYPGEAIEETITKKSKHGRTLSQDSLGLPRAHGDAAPNKPNRRRHATQAPQNLAPVTVQVNRMPRGPMTKGLPKPSAPPFHRSKSAPAEQRVKEDLPKRSKDNPGYSSVDFDDTPPASLSEKPNAEGPFSSTKGPNAGGAGSRNTSYRDFERTVFLDCNTCTYGATGKLGWGRKIRKYPNRDGTTVAEEGTIVVRGFDKPPPAKSDRILKQIDNRAKAANLASLASEENQDQGPAPSSRPEEPYYRDSWADAVGSAAALKERKVSFADEDEFAVGSPSSVDTVMARGILIPRISINNNERDCGSSSPPASLLGEPPATATDEELGDLLPKGEKPKTASLEEIEENVDAKIQASDEILNVHGPSMRVESPPEGRSVRVSPVKMEHLRKKKGGEEVGKGKGKGKGKEKE